MTARKLEHFIAKPSERGMEDWVVYEITNLARPLFVGPQEAAEFEADKRNREAQQRYQDTAIDPALAAFAKSSQIRLAQRIAWDERSRKELELGGANIVCLTALSLPV